MRAVRAAVGRRFHLMSDPVAAMTLPDALRYGRGLERLGFAWFEEPMADENIPALRELTRQLDIPVVGTEVLWPGIPTVSPMSSRPMSST
jgi:L-alanine-DL-glutamate epimerase-like enolase superfamily enzyme